MSRRCRVFLGAGLLTNCLSPFQIFLSFFFFPAPPSLTLLRSVFSGLAFLIRPRSTSTSPVVCLVNHCCSSSARRTNPGAGRPLPDISCRFVTPRRLFLALCFSSSGPHHEREEPWGMERTDGARHAGAGPVDG